MESQALDEDLSKEYIEYIKNCIFKIHDGKSVIVKDVRRFHERLEVFLSDGACITIPCKNSVPYLLESFPLQGDEFIIEKVYDDVFPIIFNKTANSYFISELTRINLLSVVNSINQHRDRSENLIGIFRSLADSIAADKYLKDYEKEWNKYNFKIRIKGKILMRLFEYYSNPKINYDERSAFVVLRVFNESINSVITCYNGQHLGNIYRDYNIKNLKEDVIIEGIFNPYDCILNIENLWCDGYIIIKPKWF